MWYITIWPLNITIFTKAIDQNFWSDSQNSIQIDLKGSTINIAHRYQIKALPHYEAHPKECYHRAKLPRIKCKEPIKNEKDHITRIQEINKSKSNEQSDAKSINRQTIAVEKNSRLWEKHKKTKTPNLILQSGDKNDITTIFLIVT